MVVICHPSKVGRDHHIHGCLLLCPLLPRTLIDLLLVWSQSSQSARLKQIHGINQLIWLLETPRNKPTNPIIASPRPRPFPSFYSYFYFIFNPRKGWRPRKWQFLGPLHHVLVLNEGIQQTIPLQMATDSGLGSVNGSGCFL